MGLESTGLAPTGTQASTGPTVYYLAASGGTFAFSGGVADFEGLIPAAGGSFAFSGGAASFLIGSPGQSGSFAYAGGDASFEVLQPGQGGAFGFDGGVANFQLVPGVSVGGGRRPRRNPEPPIKLHPEEIERQQRMVQEYLDELERRAQEEQESKAVPAGAVIEEVQAVEPRLSTVMALAATEAQLHHIARSIVAAERDREVARAEFQRRYWVRALLLTLDE